ncbi:efflux RND transporter periplasmic adaptor subunit [Novosphingobium album (ex Hu et al. 2023)]|uniref:Efflux RND transporter periplasmic adaptor subunit n=1 Tax=Novosphingobium album (ex Hu et al. 2023) TaxID=2930093 RepID=A0ABT0B2I1_9SPHN|nr:efflux RND transporter periplasmic adaptor subunit [Novosphingobium album (ex Hu et al. 2023)]MCJ2179088.1 efflux RND transporter periplasmic adaptor subunit [Novosphingobium album (ex Hu et al. 2023)]
MRKSVVVLLALAAFAVVAGLLWTFGGAGTKVTVAEVEQGPAADLVYATGYVEPEHPVIVSSRVTAPVGTVLVREGDRVVAGQALVRLDASEQQALLAQARADAQAKTVNERRVATLFRQGWVTAAANDTARASGQAARAQVAALEARLDQMTVRAGISGVVLKRDVEPGDLAVPGKTLMQLGDPAQVRITATVDERDIVRVHPGQVALLSTDALPGKVIRGRVREITPGGDPSQRAFRVRIGLDPGTSLPFGLTLEINVITREHDKALLVPAGAVAGGKVWVVRDGRAAQIPVRTGITGTEKVEIVSGLKAGDSVIVNPPEGLKDGARVRT